MNGSGLDSGNQKLHFICYSLIFIFLCSVGLFLINLIEGLNENGIGWIARKSTISILENLIAGGVAAIILAFISDYILKFVDPKNKVEEIPSSKISDRLKFNANKTNNYLFIGNTASFVTREIIPIIFKKSVETNIKKKVSIYLLDPSCDEAVKAYVSYKNRILFSDYKGQFGFKGCELCEDKKTSVDDVIATIVCTLYLAAYVSQSNFIDVEIYFRKYFTPFRADISDTEVVLTQESKKDPAVGFSERGQFFNWYKKEADVLIHQSVKIDLNFLKTDNSSTRITNPTDEKNKIEESIDYIFSEVDFLKNIRKLIGNRFDGVKLAAVDYIKSIEWRKNAI